MAQHEPWRRAGVSNNTTLVLHCDRPLDPARVREALDRFLDRCPWPGARLGRAFPWGKLRWTAGARRTLVAPTVHHREAAPGEDLDRLVEAELNLAIDPYREAPLRLTVVDVAGEQGALILTWYHPRMDPRGGQNLLAELGGLDAEDGTPTSQEPAAAGDAAPRSLSERGRIARKSLAYMRTLAPFPLVSPGTQMTAPGRARFLRARFVERDADARPSRGTREISWRLAVVGKAMAELWRQRGLPDVPFLLPIAVDLRPKGEPGPTFGNVLAFHFARFRPSDTDDVPALARALRQQMADAVRDGQIEANAVAMEFLHYRPLSMMLRALPWTSHGELFSFNCADLAEVPPALACLFGRRVVNVYHAPCVPPRPGLGVFFNRYGGLHNVVVSWIDGAATVDEAARILAIVAEEMEWIEKP